MNWLIKGYAYGYKSIAPSTNDLSYPIPYIWIDRSSNIAYILGAIIDGMAIWTIKGPDLIINEGQINQINVIGGSNLMDTDKGVTLGYASDEIVDVSEFTKNLSSQDLTVQKALNRIDKLNLGGTGTLPNGYYTGDLVRWNEDLGAWEVKSEPIQFKGIVLTPALASLIDAEGAMYYNSLQKAVLVCTSI